MTLPEAMKTGLRFKRAHDSCCRKPEIGTDRYVFSSADVLATDWETEEKRERQVLITKSSFLNAFARFVHDAELLRLPTKNALLITLGLESRKTDFHLRKVREIKEPPYKEY